MFIFIIFFFLLIMLIIAKKICDISIKAEVTKKYSSLIFSPEQINNSRDSNYKNEKWLINNSTETEIVSRDGLKLKGYEIMAEKKSDIWVIAVHGYMSNGIEMVQYAKKFKEFGYNVLIIDLRAHGQSEGKYIGMGWLDHYDLEIWIDKIVEENSNSKIILYGISMGAATVSMTTGDEIQSNVKLCIADCGYSSVWDEFKTHIKRNAHINSSIMLYFTSCMAKIFAGYSFKEASTVKQVIKSKTPTLFIHGKEDKFVPFEMLNEIYERAGCEKEKLEIDGAKHAESARVNPELYWSKIKNIIEVYLN